MAMTKNTSVRRKKIKKLKHSINTPKKLNMDRFSTLLTSKLIFELSTNPLNRLSKPVDTIIKIKAPVKNMV